MDKVSRVRDENHDRLVQYYTRVVGTGVGNKITNGEDTGKQALIVFVTAKSDFNTRGIQAQAASQKLPTHIGDVPIDVIEVGNIVKQGYASRVRPIVPGYSISHPKVTAGSLGGVFQDATGNIIALSCNHVLANENNCRIGDFIFQPGMADAPGTPTIFTGWDKIPNTPYFANLTAYSTLTTPQKNEQDSAIATIYQGFVSGGYIASIYPNGKPMSGIGTPVVGTEVQKFGRTTGQTNGRILSTGAEFTIGYDMGPVTFVNCIVATSMSQGGDSGSIMLDANMNAIGLIFAGSDKVSLANPMAPIVSKYGLSVWGSSPTPVVQPTVPPRPPSGTNQFWGRIWNIQADNGIVTPQPNGVVVIRTNAHKHAYMATPIASAPGVISCDIWSGTSNGSWGPGMVLVCPNGLFKANIRGNTGFGSAWAGRETVGIGRTSFNAWYRIQLSLGGAIVARALDLRTNQWTTILNISYRAAGGSPTELRIGKTGVIGDASDYSDLGDMETTQYTNFVMGRSARM